MNSWSHFNAWPLSNATNPACSAHVDQSFCRKQCPLWYWLRLHLHLRIVKFPSPSGLGLPRTCQGQHNHISAPIPASTSAAKSFLSCFYWGGSTGTSLHYSPGTDMNSHHVPATCLLQRFVHKSILCHAFIYLCLWCTYAPPNQLLQKPPLKLWQHQHVIRNAGMMHCLSSLCDINKDCQFPSFKPHTFCWQAFSE